ncbi:MAG: cbb3-type cytochrome c oxidase N-terminal domain-containing protein [Bacteroidia bacterium]
MKNYIKISILLTLFGVPAQIFAQGSGSSTYFSNPLFNTLLGIILFLLIIIVAFTYAMRNMVNSEVLDNRLKEDAANSKSNTAKSLALFFFTFAGYDLFSQSNSDSGYGGIDAGTFYFMISVIILETIFLTVLIYQFNFLIRKRKEEPLPSRQESSIIAVLTDAVAVEDEADIMMDHEYDGIRELDNNLPPWWKYGFYVTILFAFVYIARYHFTGDGDLQTVEYEKEIAQAKIDVERYMASAANKVDETNITLLNEKKDLDAGKETYITFCAACHGRAGEGGVGPNMTDQYWIHGGGLADVFKSIKYGWPEKGMKSWKEELSPMQISQITSFIKSIQGTNPANGKAPQGDLYSESSETVTATDSTSVAPKDSLTAVIEQTVSPEK